MIFIYKPQKVIEVRKKVEAEHTKTARRKADKDDKALKNLLNHIVVLKKEDISAFSRILSNRQVHQISEYIILNFWKLKLENLFEIILVKGTREDWDSIYNGWLKNYDKRTDGEKIRKFLGVALTDSQSFQQYILANGWTLQTLEWILNEDYITALCTECMKKAYQYSQELTNHGVKEDTMLHGKCMIVFYQICDRVNYMSIGAEDLKNRYRTWGRADKTKICVNLYDKLESQDLQKMKSILSAFDREFFEKDMKIMLSPKGYQLYSIWRNLQAVETAFGAYEDSNRRRFWLNYIQGNVFRNYMQTFVVDFGEYVAVEFKGKAAGPAYIYKKSFFEKKVMPRMSRLSKSDFQKWEYEKFHAKVDGVCERMPHTDGWQWKLSIALAKYGIRESKCEV